MAVAYTGDAGVTTPGSAVGLQRQAGAALPGSTEDQALRTAPAAQHLPLGARLTTVLDGAPA